MDNITKFDLNIGFNTNFYNICIVGGRGSGKSFYIKKILNNLNHIPNKIICSPTENVNSFYKIEYPNAEYYDNNLISEIKKKMINRFKEQEDKTKCHTIIVLDDFIINDYLTDFIINSRHYGVIIIVSTQSRLKIQIRTCFDYIFVLKNNQNKNIYDDYFGMIPNYNTFNEIYNKYTKDYGCLVIHNNNNPNKPNLYWYNQNDLSESETSIDTMIDNKDVNNSVDQYNISIIKPKNNEKIKITIELN